MSDEEPGGTSVNESLSASMELRWTTAQSFVYPEGTAGYQPTKGKYFHSLSPDQEAALTTLTSWVTEKDIDVLALGRYTLHPSLTLLRYLRANDFDCDKAISHMTSNMAWRVEKGVDGLMAQDPESILGCPMRDVTAVFPHWHSGYDKTGRPVLYKQYAKFDVAKLKTMSGVDNIARYHIWEQEQCMKLCYKRSHQDSRIVETTTGVLDLEGMRLGQVTSDFTALIKVLAQIDQAQYPETMGKMFIINTPAAFPFVWKMVKSFLDPNTAAKISIYASKKEWQPVLFEQIGKENMSSTYG